MDTEKVAVGLCKAVAFVILIRATVYGVSLIANTVKARREYNQYCAKMKRNKERMDTNPIFTIVL